MHSPPPKDPALRKLKRYSLVASGPDGARDAQIRRLRLARLEAIARLDGRVGRENPAA